MHTVSTLCATSTVAIAACGLALAQPYYSANDQLTASFNTNTPPLIEEPVDGKPAGASPNDSNFPLSAYILSATSRPSSSRRWLRRLSGSFSSSPTSSLLSFAPSSTPSYSPSRSRSATTSPQPNSRPPTRNKLVKRSPAERLSRSNSPVPPPTPRHQRRPSTTMNQPPTREQSNHLFPFHVSRPSTSGLDSSRFYPYDPESIDVWRPFFLAKRQRITQSGSGAAKLTKARGIRRIVPDLFRRRNGPTLVIAPAVNSYPTDKDINDDDTNSLCTDSASFIEASRPTSHMGETQHPRPTRQRSSTTPIPTKGSSRKSFSLSNFLGAATPKPSSTETDPDDDAIRNGFVGICSGFSRRHSASDTHPTPYPSYRHLRPTTPAFDGVRREQLPTIQSLSLLDVGLDVSLSDVPPHADAQPEEHSMPEPVSAPVVGFTARPHRLSLMSASERASTLIGSESEHDFGSDTLFDSMRTRISQVTPIRADHIFDLDRYQSDTHDNRSPFQASCDHESSTMPGMSPISGGFNDHSSSNSTHTAQQLGVAKITLDDEEDAWSSDWDIPSKSTDEDEYRLSGPSGVRSYSGMLSSSRMGLSVQSNVSNTSFGTACEGYSVDGSSMRETNSIMHWNDGVPMHTSTSPNSGYRSKAVHAKEDPLSSTRPGRRAPSHHIRSQSMPVVNTLRGRTPLPSENWDDDFLDNDDDDEFGMSKSEMVIPRAIEERQASIIGHLGCVREFALLVEDLKRLRETAIVKNIRNKADNDLWDEADGIIALATLDDDEEDAPLKDRLHRQNTWSPQRRREQSPVISEENMAYTVSSRQPSVLSPDDDIFGAPDVPLPSTPRLGNGTGVSPAPSSISPHSRKLVDKNDPIEVAKSMMEKMQHRQRSDHLAGARRNTTGTVTGGSKVHFDTDMLRDLVKQTAQLKRKLTRAVEGFPPSPEKGLRLKIRAVETPIDDKFDFGLSPVESSFDENIGGLERVNSQALEFTTVIGVA